MNIDIIIELLKLDYIDIDYTSLFDKYLPLYKFKDQFEDIVICRTIKDADKYFLFNQEIDYYERLNSNKIIPFNLQLIIEQLYEHFIISTNRDPISNSNQ